MIDIPQVAHLPGELASALSAHFGERFSVNPAIRTHHGKDESSLPPAPPDAVVFAHSTGEVAVVAALCHAHRLPLIAYGTGTSLEGHLLAVKGGICLDLSHMNRVLAIRPEDLDATVEAGVTRKAVLAATVVLPDGCVIKTGTRAKKSAAGYDLTRLFVGSEGTLGIITELTVRLHPLPEAIASAVCAFPDIAAAVNTVIQTIQLGIPVARIELLDALSISAINRYSKTTLREAPTLFFELHGSPAGVAEQTEALRAIAAEQGGMGFEWADRPEDRSRLWQARHDAYYACLGLQPGARSITTDVCVPISRLAECIAATLADREQTGLVAPLLGHVGDGNFHMLLLVKRDDDAMMARAHDFARRLAERAIAMDGSCTGEHGVGLGKRKYMALEHGAGALDVMRAIKQAIDPFNLMNPGKVLPD